MNNKTISELINELPPESLPLAEQFLRFLSAQAKQGKAVQGTRAVNGPRPFGLCAGEFVLPDDFDNPLPDDLLSSFEG